MTDRKTGMGGVLIVGGYGHVGQRIARRLLKAGHGPVRIAGRDASRAAATATGLGCEGRAMDLANPGSWAAALAGIGTVLVSIDLPQSDFAAYVLQQGIDYIDISATDAILQQIEALTPIAQQTGARAVLSVGLAPGLSNLMAKEAMAGLPPGHTVTIGVLLGLGDAHGDAAIDWTLNTLRPLHAADVQPLAFGQPTRNMLTIPFDFADQHVLRRRHGWQVETRLGFASALVTGASLRLLSRLAARQWFRRSLKWSMARLRLGSDRAALTVELHDQAGHRLRRLCLEGRAEADITALVAARVIALLGPDIPAGVHHIEEVWNLSDFTDALTDETISVTI